MSFGYVYSSEVLNLVPTTPQTANYTANVNDLVLVNGNASAPVIDLPLEPPHLSAVGVKRYDTLAGVPTFTPGNIPTIAPASPDAFLGGGTTPLQLLLQGQGFILQYNAITAQWLIRSTDQPLSQLDSRYEPLEAYAVLPSAYTLTSQTAAQQLLNTTTSGAVTLPVGRYFFECAFALTAMSSTSGSFGFGFGGAATFTQDWVSLAGKGATGFIAATPSITWATINQTLLTAANVNTVAEALIKGHINVTAAGTLIPQVSLGVAAAAVVAAGSFFRIHSVDSAAAFAGAWS